jgi:hypothetical protein
VDSTSATIGRGTTLGGHRCQRGAHDTTWFRQIQVSGARDTRNVFRVSGARGTRPFAGTSDAGGGTRTPDTRIMISQRFGSTGPRNDPGGHKRGHNRGPACTLSPWVFRAACAGAASDARGFRVVVPAVTGWRLHGKKAGHVGFEVDGRDGSDLPREPADPRDSFTLRADLRTALDLLAAVPERRRKYEEIGERLLGRGRRRVCAGPCAGRRRRGGGGRDRGRERRPARFLREGERPAPARPSGTSGAFGSGPSGLSVRGSPATRR